MQTDNITYDLIIIGGGPIGIACALEAKNKNLKYLVVEKGCLVNSLYNYPANMTFFSTSDKLELDNIPFISNNPKPRKAEALEYYRRIVVSNDLKFNLFERVYSINPGKDGLHTITTSKGKYISKNVIVATGFYDIPNYLKIPGEDLSKVAHYYDDPHFYAKQKVIVVGASNSAVDAALEIYRKGGDVTMIVRNHEIGERVKYWVRPDIINRIEEGSIKALFKAELKEIRENEVIIMTPEGEQIYENNFVLLLTGYRPNFEFLKSIGISLSEDELMIPKYNSETMESNVTGIYLAGVICGGMETHKWFIENSRIHAGMIIHDILKRMDPK